MGHSRLALISCALVLNAAAHAGSASPSQTQQALAGRFVQHAVAYCGYEPSSRGAALSSTEFGPEHDGNRQFADALWHGTFACDQAYIGTSCMAARLTLCRRTFAEYGPGGAVLPGLLKPIIHK